MNKLPLSTKKPPKKKKKHSFWPTFFQQYSIDFMIQKLFKRSSKFMKLSRSVLYISNDIFLNFQFKIPSLRPSTTSHKLQHVFDSKLTESPTVILDFWDLNSINWIWFLHSFEAMILRFLLQFESPNLDHQNSSYFILHLDYSNWQNRICT